MPMVTITGNLWETTGSAMPASREPELMFVLDAPRVYGSAAFYKVENHATLNLETGAFTADVFSDGAGHRFRYRMVASWLVDMNSDSGQEVRSRGFTEWPEWIYPDTGGPIGDLIDPTLANGLVAAGVNLPASNLRHQWQLNTQTGWLYERRVS